MCVLCVNMTSVLYSKSEFVFKIVYNFDNNMDDVYKQMPVIVTYYLLDKFVNLFVYHQRNFWIPYGIIIIYVKMYLAFCFLQVP